MSIEPFYVTFGRRLRHLRNARGISQESLGAQLVPKMTRTAICNIEAGRHRVLLHMVMDVARVLEVSVHDLVASPVRVRPLGVPPEALKVARRAERSIAAAGRQLRRLRVLTGERKS